MVSGLQAETTESLAFKSKYNPAVLLVSSTQISSNHNVIEL